MLDLSPDVANALIAAVAALLYGFAWWALRDLPMLAKVAARLLLALALLAPLALMLTLGDQAREVAYQKAEQEEARQESARQTEAETVEPSRKRAAARRAPDAGAQTPSEPVGGAGPGPIATAPPPDDLPRATEPAPAPAPPPPGAAAPPPPPPVAAAPPPPAPSIPPPAAPAASPPPAAATPPSANGAPPPSGSAPARDDSPTRGLGSPSGAPAAPPAQKEEFDIVPVFYGTDRQRAADDKRLSYGFERARQLEIGRALVTVPKSHTVPQVERPWAIRIPYFNVTIYEEAEDPNRHFTMREIKSLSRDELLALVRERLATSARYKDHAFVFVHGYNTTFDNAVYRTAQIAYDLKFDGAPFLYSWPSGGAVGSYTYDRESAGQAEPFLTEFLKMVAEQSGAKSISVIAHSMGNQLVLRVLQDLQRATPPGVVLNQLVLAAPDVDRDAFENIAKTIKGIAKGITLYAAANDYALGVSRRFHGGVPRAGDVPLAGPLLVEGIDTIDVTSASTDSLGLNHSGYAENNALVNDIALLIQTGERPPEKRVPILERVSTDKGDYWRYPPRN